jgi:hypothetical protein
VSTPIAPDAALNSKPEAIPGVDAVMTPDLLLVSPDVGKDKEPPAPLRAFVGNSVTLKAEPKEIDFDGLQGLSVIVTNDSGRPLLIDGDSAKIVVGDKTYNCASLTQLQKSVLPNRNGKAIAAGVFTKVIPTAVTVGLEPTILDAIRLKKPVRLRYGPDERRRLAEASRFGKRILWPHQKTDGVIYFKTAERLAGGKIEMPMHTLFDAADSASLTDGTP